MQPVFEAIKPYLERLQRDPKDADAFNQCVILVRHYRRILAIISGKGGVGKTLITLVSGICAALEGKRVCFIDMDPNPGLTEIFARFKELHHGEKGLLTKLQKNPLQSTVLRMLLDPGNDRALDGIALNYPLLEAIESLTHVERYKASKINTATIVDRTKATYAVTPESVGELILVPNAGSFDPLLRQIGKNEANDPTYKPYPMLAVGIDAAEQQRLKNYIGVNAETNHALSYRPIDLWVIDAPGEIGPLLRIIGHAATHIMCPFTNSDSSVSGIYNSFAEILPIQAQRKGLPKALGAVANMYNADPDEGMDEWIRHNALPRLAEVGLREMPQRISFSYDIFNRANRIGVVPWEYNPCDPSVLEIRALYQAARDQIFA